VSASLVPPWVATVVATAAAVVTDVWGQALGTDVQTATTAVAGLVVAVVAREHLVTNRAFTVAAATGPAVTVPRAAGDLPARSVAVTAPPPHGAIYDLEAVLAEAGQLAPVIVPELAGTKA
jgi:hypothetical protein